MVESLAVRLGLSRSDKARIIKHTRPGRILEIGFGTGEVLEILAAYHSDSGFVAIERDTELFELSQQRLKEYKNIHFLNADIWDVAEIGLGKFDSIVLSSSLHEILPSSNKKRLEKFFRFLKCLTRQNGVIVIRDGVKPERNSVSSVRFKSPKVKSRFIRFTTQFFRLIPYQLVEPDLVEIKLWDLHDFLNKYFFEGELWQRDMKESFGYFTLKEVVEASGSGLRVLHSEQYSLEFLTTRWSNDFEMEHPAPPSSHMLLVLEKQ